MDYNLKDVIKKESLFVYKINNEIVGVIRWHPRIDLSNTIHELCIKKGFEGQGIGLI